MYYIPGLILDPAGGDNVSLTGTSEGSELSWLTALKPWPIE